MSQEHSNLEKVVSKIEKPPSILEELWEQMKHNKKWWLTPIIISLLLLAILILLGGTGVAPFIYSLF